MLASVGVPVLNLYACPDEWSEVTSQALYGWQVQLLEEYGTFKRIRTSDQYEGWVLAKELISYRHFTGPLVKIIRNAAHIYAVPSVIKHKPIITLPFEVCLEIVDEPEEEQSRWIQVKLLDERLCWIHRQDICLDFTFLNEKQMLTLSQQFLGLPYTWGGTSSFGYDCSGFIQMLFRQMGILLPRDASQQYQDKRASFIHMKDIKPADLIFFGHSSEKISHVGLYIGNQEIIHASVKEAPILQTTYLYHSSLTSRFEYVTAYRIQSG